MRHKLHPVLSGFYQTQAPKLMFLNRIEMESVSSSMFHVLRFPNKGEISMVCDLVFIDVCWCVWSWMKLHEAEQKEITNPLVSLVFQYSNMLKKQFFFSRSPFQISNQKLFRAQSSWAQSFFSKDARIEFVPDWLPSIWHPGNLSSVKRCMF